MNFIKIAITGCIEGQILSIQVTSYNNNLKRILVIVKSLDG